MAMLTADCGRCSAKQMTHDVRSGEQVGGGVYEFFVQCRACNRTAIWSILSGYTDLLNRNGPVDNFITGKVLIRPKGDVVSAPEHTPPELKLIFDSLARSEQHKLDKNQS